MCIHSFISAVLGSVDQLMTVNVVLKPPLIVDITVIKAILNNYPDVVINKGLLWLVSPSLKRS